MWPRVTAAEFVLTGRPMGDISQTAAEHLAERVKELLGDNETLRQAVEMLLAAPEIASGAEVCTYTARVRVQCRMLLSSADRSEAK